MHSGDKRNWQYNRPQYFHQNQQQQQQYSQQNQSGYINQVKSILPLMIDEFHPTRQQSQPSTHFNRQHNLGAGQCNYTRYHPYRYTSTSSQTPYSQNNYQKQELHPNPYFRKKQALLPLPYTVSAPTQWTSVKPSQGKVTPLLALPARPANQNYTNYGIGGPAVRNRTHFNSGFRHSKRDIVATTNNATCKVTPLLASPARTTNHNFTNSDTPDRHSSCHHSGIIKQNIQTPSGGNQVKTPKQSFKDHLPSGSSIPPLINTKKQSCGSTGKNSSFSSTEGLAISDEFTNSFLESSSNDLFGKQKGCGISRNQVTGESRDSVDSLIHLYAERTITKPEDQHCSSGCSISNTPSINLLETHVHTTIDQLKEVCAVSDIQQFRQSSNAYNNTSKKVKCLNTYEVKHSSLQEQGHILATEVVKTKKHFLKGNTSKKYVITKDCILEKYHAYKAKLSCEQSKNYKEVQIKDFKPIIVNSAIAIVKVIEKHNSFKDIELVVKVSDSDQSLCPCLDNISTIHAIDKCKCRRTENMSQQSVKLKQDIENVMTQVSPVKSGQNSSGANSPVTVSMSTASSSLVETSAGTSSLGKPKHRSSIEISFDDTIEEECNISQDDGDFPLPSSNKEISDTVIEITDDPVNNSQQVSNDSDVNNMTDLFHTVHVVTPSSNTQTTISNQTSLNPFSTNSNGSGDAFVESSRSHSNMDSASQSSETASGNKDKSAQPTSSALDDVIDVDLELELEEFDIEDFNANISNSEKYKVEKKYWDDFLSSNENIDHLIDDTLKITSRTRERDNVIEIIDSDEEEEIKVSIKKSTDTATSVLALITGDIDNTFTQPKAIIIDADEQGSGTRGERTPVTGNDVLQAIVIDPVEEDPPVPGTHAIVTVNSNMQQNQYKSITHQEKNLDVNKSKGDAADFDSVSAGPSDNKNDGDCEKNDSDILIVIDDNDSLEYDEHNNIVSDQVNTDINNAVVKTSASSGNLAATVRKEDVLSSTEGVPIDFMFKNAATVDSLTLNKLKNGSYVVNDQPLVDLRRSTIIERITFKARADGSGNKSDKKSRVQPIVDDVLTYKFVSLTNKNYEPVEPSILTGVNCVDRCDENRDSKTGETVDISSKGVEVAYVEKDSNSDKVNSLSEIEDTGEVNKPLSDTNDVQLDSENHHNESDVNIDRGEEISLKDRNQKVNIESIQEVRESIDFTDVNSASDNNDPSLNVNDNTRTSNDNEAESVNAITKSNTEVEGEDTNNQNDERNIQPDDNHIRLDVSDENLKHAGEMPHDSHTETGEGTGIHRTDDDAENINDDIPVVSDDVSTVCEDTNITNQDQQEAIDNIETEDELMEQADSITDPAMENCATTNLSADDKPQNSTLTRENCVEGSVIVTTESESNTKCTDFVLAKTVKVCVVSTECSGNSLDVQNVLEEDIASDTKSSGEESQNVSGDIASDTKSSGEESQNVSGDIASDTKSSGEESQNVSWTKIVKRPNLRLNIGSAGPDGDIGRNLNTSFAQGKENSMKLPLTSNTKKKAEEDSDGEQDMDVTVTDQDSSHTEAHLSSVNSNKESNNGGVTGSQGDVGGLVSDYFVIDSCIDNSQRSSVMNLTDDDSSDDDLFAVDLPNLNTLGTRPAPSTPTKLLDHPPSLASPKAHESRSLADATRAGSQAIAGATTTTRTASPVTLNTTSYDLDAMLEKRRLEVEEEKEMERMVDRLKAGIDGGGVANFQVEEVEGDLMKEHRDQLDKWKIQESVIKDIHPGEDILSRALYRQLYTHTLTPAQCGFVPGTTYLEKQIPTLPQSMLVDMLSTGIFEHCLTSFKSPHPMLDWILYIMVVHPSVLVVQKCCAVLRDTLRNQHGSCGSWSPSAKHITRVLVNMGCSLEKLNSKFTLEQLRFPPAVNPPNGPHPVNMNLNNNCYGIENMRYMIKVLTIAVKERAAWYSTVDLISIINMIATASLDTKLNSECLLTDFQICLSVILDVVQPNQWANVVSQLCSILPKLTSHHHNLVHLVQLFPASSRGRVVSRRLSLTLLKALLGLRSQQYNITQPDVKVSELFQPVSMITLKQNTDFYTVSSYISLIDLTVGNETPKTAEKRDLSNLIDMIRSLTGEVRESIAVLDRTMIKDMMVRLASKWTFMLQNMGTKQSSIFDWVNMGNVEDSSQEIQSSQPKSDVTSDEAEK